MTVMMMVLVLNGNNDGDGDDDNEVYASEGHFTSFAGQRGVLFIITLISVKFTTRIATVYCRM